MYESMHIDVLMEISKDLQHQLTMGNISKGDFMAAIAPVHTAILDRYQYPSTKEKLDKLEQELSTLHQAYEEAQESSDRRISEYEAYLTERGLQDEFEDWLNHHIKKRMVEKRDG